MQTAIKGTPTSYLVAALALAAIVGSCQSALAGSWVVESSMPTPTIGSAVGSINGIVYVAGGDNSSFNQISSLQAYNPTTNTWQTLANLPTALVNPCAATEIDGKLYVAGGSNTSGILSSLYVYDPVTNSWATKASMSHTCTTGGGGEIGGKLYVSTGIDDFSYSSAFDMYDPSTNSWTSLTPSSSGHSNPASGVINGKYYLAGGTDLNGNNSAVLEVYNPVTGAWTTLQSLPTELMYSASVALNGKLYAIGGCTRPNNCNRASRKVYAYDPVVNAWATAPSIPSPVWNFGATLDYGLIFALGGRQPDGCCVVGTNIYFAVKPSIP